MKFILIAGAKRRSAFALAAALLSAGSLSLSACSDSEADKGDSGGQGGATGGSASGGHHSSGGSATGGSATGGENQGGQGGDVGTGGDVGSGGTTPEPTQFVTRELEDLAVTSSLNYDNNAYGVISGSTLAAYQHDWAANRPAGVTGRLIILQVQPPTSGSNLAPIGATQVTLNDEENGVFSYIVKYTEFAQARDSGLSNFETDIPDGPTADKLIKKYGIDPTQDFIVLTFEKQPSTTNTVVQSVGRAWVFFNYWGIPKERLAILNGSIDTNTTAGLQVGAPITGFSKPKNNGTKSFRDLHVDQTIVSISQEEILAILRGDVGAPDKNKIRIVDARGGAEAYGLLKATSTGRTKCASFDPGTAAGPGGVPAAVPGNPLNQKCSTPFEGRIVGAQSVPWTQFVQGAAQGFRFLSPANAKVLFDQQSGWVDGTHKSTIQYCRTNQRSTVTGIIANLVLGYPTRLYETSFIEWGHVSAGPPDEGEETFPNKSLVSDSFAFRTDVEAFTEHAVLHPDDAGAYVPGGTLGVLTKPVTWVAGPNYNLEADINPASAIVGDTWPKLNPTATTTRASIDADRAYLQGE